MQANWFEPSEWAVVNDTNDTEEEEGGGGGIPKDRVLDSPRWKQNPPKLHEGILSVEETRSKTIIYI